MVVVMVVMVVVVPVVVVVVAPRPVVVVARRPVVVVWVIPVAVVVVMFVPVLVMVMVVVGVHLPGLAPDRDRPDQDEHRHRDPADQNRDVELRGEDELERVARVHPDGDEPEQPAHQDGQELFGEVVARRPAVVVVSVTVVVGHDAPSV
jgi:hypothetical protein